MNDREFLMWVHERLARNGDSELLDFMHKLRAIIAATPADRLTPNVAASNSLAALRLRLQGSDA